jgi:hypothetical protein
VGAGSVPRRRGGLASQPKRNEPPKRSGSRRSDELTGDPTREVFLNIPYDEQFADLFLAYVSGLAALNLYPRTTLEIAGGERRLDRTFELIQRCRYSVHDLSRVQVDVKRPTTPRFNMPFELGLAVAWQRMQPREHTWFVFEAKSHRIEKSLSDLGGTDVYIHHGRPSGLFSELTNAFVRAQRQPSVYQMRHVHVGVRRGLPDIMRKAGTRSAFKAQVFERLRLLAVGLSESLVT